VSTPAATGKRNFRGVSPEDRKAERRKRLVEAGLEAFGVHGFLAVGVREICGLAKLTERYFYESFENREALFAAVYMEAAQRIRTAIAAAHAKARPEPTAFARAGLEATLRTFRDDPRIARILLLEMFAVSNVGEVRLVESQAFADEIAAITKAFHPDIDEKHLNADIIGNGLYGATVYIAMRWALEGFRAPLEVVLDHCVLFYEALEEKMRG
jgi:AcrR family transcriptional regulator